MSYKNFQFSHELRVDPNTHGAFPTLRAAVVHAATLSPSSGNPVKINLTDHRFIETAGKITIPSWVVVDGDSNHGEDFTPSCEVWLTPLAGETETLDMEPNSVVSGIEFVFLVPPSFSADHSLVNMQGDNKIDSCRMEIAPGYNGANEATMLNIMAGGSSGGPIISRSTFAIAGTGTVLVKAAEEFAAYYCNFLVPGNIIDFFRLTYTSGALSATELVYCRMFEGGATVLGTGTILSAGARLRLYSTRIPLNQRSTTGIFVELHPTPQQLETAFRAQSVTKSANYTIDAYADGTVEVDTTGLTIDLPPIADAILGQTFIVKLITTGIVTIDGNGAAIDGAATKTITNEDDSLAFQKNDDDTWSIVLSHTQNQLLALQQGVNLEDEGTPVTGTPHKTMDFVGAGVTVTNAGGGKATVTIPGGGAGELAICQARRTTDYTVTVSFADVTLDTTDEESDSAIIEHDGTLTDRILLKETGNYLIGYFSNFDFESSVSEDTKVESHLRLNDTSVIPGTFCRKGDHYSGSGVIGEDPFVMGHAVISATAGDYITLQMRFTDDAPDTLSAQDVSVYAVRLQGTKGDTGDTGAGSNIIVQKDDVTVGTVTDTLNFEGGGVTSVVDDGGNKTTVTVSGGTFNGQIRLNSPITDTIGVAQNDYNPPGFSTCNHLRINATANLDITGFEAQPDGTLILISSVGTGNVKLKNSSALSLAANRILASADMTIDANESKWIVYDGTSSRWRHTQI